MAWRDSRRNRSRLFLFISSIILGIAALVAIYSFEYNLRNDIDSQAKTLLGADLIIETNKTIQEESLPMLKSLGTERSEERTFASMIYFQKNGGTRLVNVRALSGDFPYYGNIETTPKTASRSFRLGKQALVDKTLMLQYDAKPGDSIKVGEVIFEIAGVLNKAPGQTGFTAAVAPIVALGLLLARMCLGALRPAAARAMGGGRLSAAIAAGPAGGRGRGHRTGGPLRLPRPGPQCLCARGCGQCASAQLRPGLHARGRGGPHRAPVHLLAGSWPGLAHGTQPLPIRAHSHRHGGLPYLGGGPHRALRGVRPAGAAGCTGRQRRRLRPSAQGLQVGVEHYLPDVAVRVLEVAAIAAPEGGLGGFEQAPTGGLGLGQHLAHLVL